MPAIWRDIPLQWVPFQARLRAALRYAGVYATSTASATGDITLTGSPTFIAVDTTAGSVTLTLPLAASAPGHRVEVKKTVAANTLTLEGNGAETIDGAANKSWTTALQSYAVVSDGTQWWVV